ncbi:MAG: putative multidrug efflux pump, outer membrane protein [Clostridia bacterium]|jgi:outer membrane protein TolC|nr:putative multidrug efflux pump, outer membrane protein [Clostridia bacterium]
MKNLLKKLLTLGLSLTLLGTIPIYAAETNPVLTLDAAIESAYSYSNQISLNVKEKDVLKESLKAKEGSTYYNYYNTYLQKAKNEQQRAFIQDQIAYDITSRYNDLVLLEKEIAKLDTTIAIKNTEMNSQKLKKQLGLVSSLNYANTEVELDTLKITLAAKLESLNNDRSYFKLLTGKDLTQYVLDDTLSFEIFRIPGSIENYISDKINIQLKYDTEMAQLSAANILQEGDPAMPWSDYLDAKYQSDKTFSSLEDTKKTLRQSLLNSYASLLSVEEQIGTTKTQLTLAKKNLEMSKLQHEQGTITTADYQSQALSVQELEYTLRSSINNCISLKNSIEKPWAASGN